MLSYEVEFVGKMLRQGTAYTVDTKKGIYVLMDCNYYKPKYKPIGHDDVNEHMRNPNDYVIWIPHSNEKKSGVTTEWGIGLPSANLYVCCIYGR